MHRGLFYAESTRKICGKSRKMSGKSFHFFPFHSSTSCLMTRFRGRFRSFLRSFSEKIREFRRKIENLVEFSRKSFLFIPFLSSIPQFYALQHVFETILSEEWKFLAFFLVVPNILLTFANAYKKIVINPAGWPLSPMASGRRLFLCLGKSFFSNWENNFFQLGK